jgi:energy-coupling factor transporter ATP-binding protein EcfA2
MQQLNSSSNARGSEWHRWDPHLHSPGTILNDQFSEGWEAYVSRIESITPKIEALGVTDYFSVATYREICVWKATQRMPNVGLIFPNVEMRLDIKTEKKKPINIHLLFSPDDPNHVQEIERILGLLEFEFEDRTYKCTTSDLISLGRAFDPTQTDEHAALRVGTTQFKTTLAGLQSLFRREDWVRKNCLVAVSGNLGDGTSGLQDDDSFAATRREIERFAHIIFSSTPSQRDFWLGNKTGTDSSYIEKTYGALKPCLHGSDAHDEAKVGTPDLDRYCWIKGDLSFETLRQAVIEPDERVWLGNAPPAYAMDSVCIQQVQPKGMPWLQNPTIELNAGLIAVIGARGSGKTALVDVIASGAGALGYDLDDSSFLKRAGDYLQDAEVRLVWGDGSAVDAAVVSTWPGDEEEHRKPDVCYLSQHFVERLCSSAGLATELRHEMERVVFDTTDPTDRMGASSFQELADNLLDPIHRRREDLERNVQTATQSIVQEGLLLDKLPKLEKQRDELAKQIEKDRKDLAALLPKGNQQRAKRLSEVEQAYNQIEAKIEACRLRRKRLDDLAGEIAHVRTSSEPARLAAMRQRFSDLKFSVADWSVFSMTFVGNVDAILKEAAKATDKQISVLTEGDARTPIDKNSSALLTWPFKLLKTEKETVSKEVGIDSQKRKKYTELLRAVEQKETTLRRLKSEIENAQGSQARRQLHSKARRGDYARVFITLIEEQNILERLYAPLRSDLAGAKGALTKLQFIVRRCVELEKWISEGEQLLDLRKASAFQGHGALKEKVSQLLVLAWQQGSAEEVAAAMDDFLEKYQPELLKAKPTLNDGTGSREWLKSVANWFYGTSHIRVQYGIQYEGVAIEQLSPGTRGIVLLLLYLAVDRQDLRPLIVDQPEENLDPHSVFRELVPHFREARKRRQVIVVTHNANLVVNTDADQVIVATSVQSIDGGLPSISYECGSLENSSIRRSVCEILEGGERAFLERERRYRLHWGERGILPGPSLTS